MTRATRQQGFSILEVMIVMVIMGIVTAQMWVVFSSQKRTFLKQDAALEVQEDARLITDLIAFDTRQAGFMVPNTAAVSSTDGQAAGNDFPDRFCVSDSTSYAIPDYGQSDPIWDAAQEPFGGVAAMTVAQQAIVLQAGGDLDVDGDGLADFQVPAAAFGPDGGGVIISDQSGRFSYCGRIAAWIPPQIMLEPNHQMTAQLANNLSLGGAIVVPAIIYEVDEPNLTLMRNGTALATQVEDLQVEYWIDAGIVDTMDAGEFPVHDLSNLPNVNLNFATDLIKRVRISVITRSKQADVDEGKQFVRHRRPAAGNRAEGVPDLFPRRRFTSSVVPRNSQL
jgi:prepilin-type N-terminal cleavage/methylation domain-containing protein